MGSFLLGIVFLLFFMLSLLLGYLPCILGIIVSVIIIFLIKKTGGKKQEFYCTVVAVICVIISVELTPLWYKYIRARPDDTYIKMKEINDNKSLIGLSKEQVIELLGEQKNNDSEIYTYSAGKVTNYITLGTNDFYYLKIIFDENGKVESTTLNLSDWV